MEKSLAAVTMVYNEPEYLPLWCRYYGAQVGPEHCYIIDHGTSDGSTDSLSGFNVIKIPRSPKDNTKRTNFVSRFSTALLEWYSFVLHCDVDEIVVADPERHSGIRDFVQTETCGVVNAIGFDIHHLPLSEKKISLDLPIFSQRKWARFSAAMCKPVLTSRPLTWAPGFHSADAPIKFRDLYLFHLRYFDLSVGLARLHRTRAMSWSSDTAGRHQRVEDQAFEDLMLLVARQPRQERPLFSPGLGPVSSYLQRVLDSEQPCGPGKYNLDLQISGNELLELPERFRTCV